MDAATDMRIPRARDVTRTASASKLLCILNGAAGSNRAEQARDEILAGFAACKCPVEVLVARRGEEISEYARLAAEQQPELVIGAGGDGTLNTIAAEIVGTSTALGILPLGTLNHFARDLRIPFKLDEAIATVLSGDVATVDVGEVSDRIFLNNSSIGVYPGIVQEREKAQQNGLSKWAALTFATAAVLRKYPTVRVALETSTKQTGRYTETPFIFVGNNRYELSGLNIGERQKLDTGNLWVCRAPHLSRVALGFEALRRLCGIAEKGRFDCFETPDLVMKLRQPEIDVATDGEVHRLPTPLRYRVRPRALRVIARARTNATA